MQMSDDDKRYAAVRRFLHAQLGGKKMLDILAESTVGPCVSPLVRHVLFAWFTPHTKAPLQCACFASRYVGFPQTHPPRRAAGPYSPAAELALTSPDEMAKELTGLLIELPALKLIHKGKHGNGLCRFLDQVNGKMMAEGLRQVRQYAGVTLTLANNAVFTAT